MDKFSRSGTEYTNCQRREAREVSLRALKKKKKSNHFWLCQCGSQLTNILLGRRVGISEAIGVDKMKVDLFEN